MMSGPNNQMPVIKTPCKAPPLSELEEPRYLDQPLYVPHGRIIGTEPNAIGVIQWEKWEAVLPVI